MSYIADLHIHSHFSRATSGDCALPGLHAWAQRKGVAVVGTGDFTHPGWLSELREQLEPSAPGLYRLKAGLAREADEGVPPARRAAVDFMLTAEISSIYKRGGQLRKVHSVLAAPDLATAEAISARLGALGNVKSDGRPILGLDPRSLLEILLEINEDAWLAPAHVWTPWFSMLGSKSGFDSPAECFGDLEKHVFAAETGLSSDPPMNWRVSSLDRYCLISNSDLHSPAKLGRNANVFHGEPSYFAIRDALRDKDPARAGGTIDLFPEEGKYHADGHRKCGVCLEPEEASSLQDTCPVCGKPLTLGVLHRVVELSDRPRGFRPATALPCQYIIPLDELLAEIFDCGAAGKKVTTAWERLIATVGSELEILRETPLERLESEEPRLLGEAVRRMREGRVIRQPGYDGEYGVIRVFRPGEMDTLRRQSALFSMPAEARETAPVPGTRCDPAVGGLPPQAAGQPKRRGRPRKSDKPAAGALAGLSDEQRAAVEAVDAPVAVVAGPGAGKTRTLAHRVAWLIDQGLARPSEILVVTFTNRAAGEMRERLSSLLGSKAEAVATQTFHAFCLDTLRRFAAEAGLPPEFRLVDGDDQEALLRQAGMSAREARDVVAEASRAWREMRDPADTEGGARLSAALAGDKAVALDALAPVVARLLAARPDVRQALGLRWVCVDEYQDADRAQYELVKALLPDGKGLCVIGDPDQAIYGFRGADVSFFLRFAADFPGAKVMRLGRNYRSSGSIVAAAGQVMAPGRTAMSVSVESALDAGALIRFHEAPTAAAEAEFIAHEIEKWLGGVAHFSVDTRRVDATEESQTGFGDIAVLVRLRSLMKPVAEALERLGLPAQISGEERFLDLPGAREAAGLLRRDPDRARPAREAVEALRLAAGGLDKDGQEAWARLERLAAGFKGSLGEFADRLLLRQAVDDFDRQAQRVALMTLHAAKGLEFDVVFVAACEDGALPYKPAFLGTRCDPALGVLPQGVPAPDVAEERRLLYVGMTRARKALYLTSARRRMIFGRMEDRAPSPFLAEIKEELRERLAQPKLKAKPKGRQMDLFG